MRSTRLTEVKIRSPRVQVPPRYAEAQVAWRYLVYLLAVPVLMVLGAAVAMIVSDEVM